MLEPSDELRQYKYSSLFKLSQYIMAIFSLVLILLSLTAAFSLVKQLLNPSMTNIVSTGTLIEDFFGGILYAIFFFSLIYSLPAIQVNEWGLHLQAFPLKTFEIKRSDIQYIKQAGWKPLLYKRKETIVVVRNGLTHFHRLCGIVYTRTIQPSFVISPFINDYDRLLREISDGVKKGRRTARQNQS